MDKIKNDIKNIVECNIDLKKEKYLNSSLNDIKNKIEKMDKTRHIDILKIFIKNNISYTENKNGIFINLSELDNTIIYKVYNYIQYLEIQDQVIEEFEKEKNEYIKLL
jgi:hypothetical protein